MWRVKAIAGAHYPSVCMEVNNMHVVLCEAYGDRDYICGAENREWEDRNNTFWFTCVECGADNEVVYKWD